MAEEYTPSDQEVRDVITSSWCNCVNHLHGCVAEHTYDRWLAAHDAEVKAEAWDEGFAHGVLGHITANPYRMEAPHA